VVTAEVPIILVGTYKAAAMLKQETSLARRIAEGGFYQLKRPASPRDENWQALCKVVWKHQWVKEPLAITEEVVRTLYDYSQGITGIMINIFVAAQFHALEEGIETISSSLNELPRSKLRGINSLQPLQDHAASCGELDPLF